MARARPPGISLEIAVARMQALLDPASEVIHDKVLVDRIGNKRQFDVVVRGTFAGHAVLAVVECKDHGRRKGPDSVEAFAKKCENVGADLKVMVSRLGFTRQAVNLAKHENIRCLSLLPGDERQTGLALRATCYARIWSWKDIRFALVPDFPQIGQFDANHFLLGGKHLLALFDEDLDAHFPQHRTPGAVRRVVRFDRPSVVSVGDQCIEVTAIKFAATRACSYRRRDIQYFGDAVFDWQKEQWTVPNAGEVVSTAWRGDFSEWQEVAEPLPEALGQPFQWILDIFLPPRSPLTAVSKYKFRVAIEGKKA